MYIPAPNYVLVKPDADHETDRTGLVRRDFVDAHLKKSVTGTVVAVCEHLIYGWARSGEADGAADMTQASLQWDTDIEVKAGDRVLFHYMATIDPDRQVLAGHYLVRYDELTLRLDDNYPLNGYLLLQVGTERQEVAGLQVVKSGPLADMVSGRVIAEGKPLREYLLLEDSADFTASVVGKRVVYKKMRATRLEVEDWKTVGEGDWSLYKVHRRHIALII